MKGYKPALDGIRALSVIAVLVFHGEMGAPGGFLGVSIFFTLSGFLITALLLTEWASTGRISVRAFYGRRLRRLTPAAFLCFALVLALGAFWTATQRRELPGDLLASMFDVANWRFAYATTSYQELFIGAPSPVAHFWSLAIEEQFYLVLPLVAVVALRRSRRTFTITAWLLLAASILATILTDDRDLLYNGTHTRAAEVLFGVVLALTPLRRRNVQRVLRVAAPVALSGLIVLVLKATIADAWLYQGGLIVVGFTSALLIGGVAYGGPLSRVLGNPTLAALGRISYGLYLFHWPIFLVLTEERLGFGGIALFGVRCVVSLAAAIASFRLLEEPVRARRRFVSARLAGLAAGTSLAALAAAALIAVPAPRFTETEALLELGAQEEVIPLTPTPASLSTRLVADEDPAAPDSVVDDVDDVDDPTTTSPSAPTDASTTDPTSTTIPDTVAPPSPPRVLVVGNDPGPLEPLAEQGYEVIDGLQRDCPVSTAVEIEDEDGELVDTSDCTPSWIVWARHVRESSPDIVVVSTGPIDRMRSRGPGDADFPAPGSLVEGGARLDAEEDDLRAAVDVLADAQLKVWFVDHRGDLPKGHLDDRLARVALTDRTVQDVLASDEALVAAIDDDLSADEPVRPLRVLVIGDSVSLNFARGLADGVPGTLDVVWAGQNGCPFVRAEATRVTSNAEWELNTCRPFDEKLPPILDEFDPDVVVMMVSLRELSDQLYAGDDAAHAPGDAAFTAFHDSEMAALMAILGPRGIPLLVTDAPPIIPGGMASSEMADLSRLDAWNAQVEKWAADWETVDLIEYAAPLLAYEEEHGRIRTDGVHPEIDPLTEIAAAVYVPAVIAQTAALRKAAATG